VELKSVLLFGLATLVETVNPGPTLALVLSTAISAGRRNALYAVLGIGFANAAWALLVFALSGLSSGTPLLLSLFQLFAAGYLIFLASQRIISAAVEMISSHRDVSSKQPNSRGSAWGPFAHGFIVHASNPLTPPYYFGPFYAVTLGSWKETVICGGIAAFSDLIVYGLVVLWIAKQGVVRKISVAPYLRLFAGLLFLFLVAHVFSVDKANSTISVSVVTTIAMFFGFLAAVLSEARRFVLIRKGAENTLLWRITGMWGTFFSIATVMGGIFTLYQVLDGSTEKLDLVIEQKLRICFIVSAILAAGLAFAKSFGEVQDKQHPAGASAIGIDPQSWQANPIRSALVAVLTLVLLLFSLVITDFSVK
jgi:threonine/homoserine/homoserine lactone efflux protein